MAAQFAASLAVSFLLPASERLRGADRQSSVFAEVIKQAIGQQALHVAAIPFGNLGIDAGQQLDLRHREWLDFCGDVLARELDRRFEWRDFGRGGAAWLAGVWIRCAGWGWCWLLRKQRWHRSQGHCEIAAA